MEIRELPNSEIEIESAISVEDFLRYKKEAVERLGIAVTIEGFRKGHVPEKILVEKLGLPKILEEAAQGALSEEYPKIIKKHGIDAIGRPEITIMKLADGNPLEFKIKTAVYPKITLPDYKKIAKDEMTKKDSEPIVEEKEITEVLEEVRRRKNGVEKHQNENTPETLIDDVFAKSLGTFESLDELKKSIRGGLLEEKKWKQKDKKRLQILENISKRAGVVLPQILIENEEGRMILELKSRIEESGITWNDYLANVKKTEDDLKKEWADIAKKRVIVNIIVNEIARLEHITADTDEVKKEVDQILAVHKNADKDAATRYVDGVLVYRKVYELLEKEN